MNPVLKRMLFWCLPLLAFLILMIFLGGRLGKDPSLLPSARLNHPIPSFQLTTVENSQKFLSEKDLPESVYLMNVWATWCPSCQAEHAALLKIAQEGVTIVGVNYKDDGAAASQFLNTHGNPFIFSLADEKGNFGLDLGVYGAPETYLIDQKGVIRYRYIGIVDEKSWQSILKPRYLALKENKPFDEGITP
jgi:cytochrome c biogenesis protein CcmG/thiol:disulfide interchange protein DsbE